MSFLLSLFLLSQFPARWASCHSRCTGFLSHSASTLWASAELGFCRPWPPPRGGPSQDCFNQLNLRNGTRYVEGVCNFLRSVSSQQKIWNGGPVLPLGYSLVLFGKQRKIYPWGMRAGWPKRRVGLSLGPVLYVFFSSPLSLPYVTWVSQAGCLFHPRSSLWSLDSFSLLCLLATTILDSFFLF